MAWIALANLTIYPMPALEPSALTPDSFPDLATLLRQISEDNESNFICAETRETLVTELRRVANGLASCRTRGVSALSRSPLTLVPLRRRRCTYQSTSDSAETEALKRPSEEHFPFKEALLAAPEQ